MSARLYCYVHLSFIIVSVVDVKHWWGLFGESLFWALVTASVIACFEELLRKDRGIATCNAQRTGSSTSTEPDSKEVSTGFRILQARYGIKHKDVDVTALVQSMVKNNALVLEKSLNFNQIFGGDPAKLRLKKLRVLALVNGQPSLRTIPEWRMETVVIGGAGEDCISDHEEGNPGSPDKEPADQPLQRLEDFIAHSTRDVVTKITREFNALQISLPFDGVATQALLQACELVAEFVSLFGSSVLPVRANITDNIVKIQKQVSDRNVRGETVPPQISAMIACEVKAGKAKKEGTVCLSSLWLKRALDFMSAFLHSIVIDGEQPVCAAASSYKSTLEPLHGMALKLTCRTAFKMVPDRARVLNAVRNGNATDEAVLGDLRRMIEAVSPVIHAMDRWFDEEGLNFSDKV